MHSGGGVDVGVGVLLGEGRADHSTRPHWSLRGTTAKVRRYSLRQGQGGAYRENLGNEGGKNGAEDGRI